MHTLLYAVLLIITHIQQADCTPPGPSTTQETETVVNRKAQAQAPKKILSKLFVLLTFKDMRKDPFPRSLLISHL